MPCNAGAVWPAYRDWRRRTRSRARGALRVLEDYPRLPGTTWWLSRVAGPSRSPIVGQLLDWLLAQGDPASDGTNPAA